jgi:hypothetical protein
MDPEMLALLELLLVFGAALGFAAWQLISLRRAKRSKNRPDEPGEPLS